MTAFDQRYVWVLSVVLIVSLKLFLCLAAGLVAVQRCAVLQFPRVRSRRVSVLRLHVIQSVTSCVCDVSSQLAYGRLYGVCLIWIQLLYITRGNEFLTLAHTRVVQRIRRWINDRKPRVQSFYQRELFSHWIVNEAVVFCWTSAECSWISPLRSTSRRPMEIQETPARCITSTPTSQICMRGRCKLLEKSFRTMTREWNDW